MKESSWEECVETNAAVKVSPDRQKAASLIDTATGRNEYLQGNAITESNANYIFEGYYSSLLEMLHALLLLHGHKMNNHICIGYYVRDILKREDMFRIFDDCRFKRNALVYYGERMSFETAKASIEKCKKLIQEIVLISKT